MRGDNKKDDPDTAWKRFLHNFPVTLMKLLVLTIVGSLELGVEFFARLLHRIDPKAAMRGMGKEGAIIIPRRSMQSER